MQYTAFDRFLAEADLVLTAEGAIDAKTPFGKVPAEVGRRAREQGVPVIALAGSLGEGCDDVLAHGIDAFAGILGSPCTHDEALRTTAAQLERAAESAMRMVRIGMRLSQDGKGAGGRPLAGTPSAAPDRRDLGQARSRRLP
jgi:glycerate kinase